MEMNQATMKKSPAVQLEAPRLEHGKALLIAGLREHYTPETMKNIPALWQRLGPSIGYIPGQAGRVTYGACFNVLRPEGRDYLSGVAASSLSGLHRALSGEVLPEHDRPVLSK